MRGRTAATAGTAAFAAFAVIAVIVVSGSVAGCGGGSDSAGGRDLTAQITYSGVDVDVFTPLLVLPVILGLNGATPHCTLTSGSLPPGVQVQDGCNLVGTPSAPGSFTATVSLTIAGISGSVSVAVQTTVRAPALAPVRTTAVQPPDQLLVAGVRLDGLAIVTLRNVTPRTSAAVRYAVASGALPAGLALDAGDGTLSGTPQAPGRSTFNIVATLTQGLLALATSPQTVVLDVR